MVLLAAAVCTKSGKPLLSRQFVEMSRARIEGLLTAFPKLIGTDHKSPNPSARQHTFVETDSVRYVYQPLDALYMMLITTKNSNILEDLETLRLFSRVIPEYCRAMEEKEIITNAFDLIFAFDEIVALGYRESVNLAQIRTLTEMDSHEERVFYQIKKTQEEEAKKLARDKAKELSKARLLDHKGGGRGGGGMGMRSMADTKYEPVVQSITEKPKPKPAPRPLGPNRALKLGAKKVDEDQFVAQLASEGQEVASAVVVNTSSGVTPSVTHTPRVQEKGIHVRTEEKLSLVMSRDGGVQSMEVTGLVTMRVNDGSLAHCKLYMNNNDTTRGAQVQTHPNLDKKAWSGSSVLAMKTAGRPFPVNNDVGVLKWRAQSTEEGDVPLTINCWPSENSNGCEVNVEYSLEGDFTLHDVVITIPLPPGCAPVIGECDGEYKVERGKQHLLWTLPLIDSTNASGSLELSTASGHADHFFPIHVTFHSAEPFVDITPSRIVGDDGEEIPFSQEATFHVQTYEIV